MSTQRGARLHRGALVVWVCVFPRLSAPHVHPQPHVPVRQRQGGRGTGCSWGTLGSSPTTSATPGRHRHSDISSGSTSSPPPPLPWVCLPMIVQRDAVSAGVQSVVLELFGEHADNSSSRGTSDAARHAGLLLIASHGRNQNKSCPCIAGAGEEARAMAEVMVAIGWKDQVQQWFRKKVAPSPFTFKKQSERGSWCTSKLCSWLKEISRNNSPASSDTPSTCDRGRVVGGSRAAGEAQ